jgi:hypothetical protein
MLAAHFSRNHQYATTAGTIYRGTVAFSLNKASSSSQILSSRFQMNKIVSRLKPKRLDLLFSAFLDYALARIERGRLVLVPHNTQVGDKIALLKGGKGLFVVMSRNLSGH